MRSFTCLATFLISACCVQNSFGQSHSAHGPAASITVSSYHARSPNSAGYCAACQGAPNQYGYQPSMPQGASCPPVGCGSECCESTSFNYSSRQSCLGGCLGGLRQQCYAPAPTACCYQSELQPNTCCAPDEYCSGCGDVCYEECPPEPCCIEICFQRLWDLEKRKNAWIFERLGLR